MKALWLAALAATTLYSTLGQAEEGQLPIDVQVPAAVIVGKGQPFVQLTARAPVRDVQVKVSRKGWQRQFRVGALKAGQSRSFSWGERPGIYGYTVTVQAKRGKVTARQSLTMELSYLPAIEMQLTRDRIDLSRRQLTFFLNHPAERAEVIVRGPSNITIASAEQQYDGAAPGTPVTVSWPEARGTISRIEVTAHSTAGFWTGMAVTPWSESIPHEEVVFATDRWDIEADEEPKLDAAVELIHKALREHGSEFAVNLYIGGFTDTVGSQGHNRDLSQKRARAIAAYFARQNVRIPIYFRGFGEEVPAVNTGDETDEPRNRRATYILAPQAPVVSEAVRWGSWQRIGRW